MNQIKANKKYIHDEIFWNYFKYQNPSFLGKHTFRATQAKNEQSINNVNDGLIDLRKAIIRKEISENENLNKIVDIVEKILDFNKQRKGKRIKILTPKKMLQTLPIALVQVKAGNTSENFLNEIRQIIYPLDREKAVTKVIKHNGYYIYEL